MPKKKETMEEVKIEGPQVGDTLLLTDEPQVAPAFRNRPGIVKKLPSYDEPRIILTVVVEGAVHDLFIDPKHTKAP